MKVAPLKAFIFLCGFLGIPCYAFLNPPQFISLVPPGGYEVLERENQLSLLCPPTMTKDTVTKNKATKDLEKCRAEKLKPQTWKLTLYEEPKKDSKIIGKMMITVTPGKGVRAEFFSDGKKSVSVDSDSKQTDWGYSSFFEFSMKDLRGDWIQLPKRPFATPVWINLKMDWPLKGPSELLPSPQKMETEAVYSAGALGNIVILKFSGSTVTFRKENENDMLCGEEPQKIPLEMLKETTKPVDILFDSDGHLISWPAYSKGC